MKQQMILIRGLPGSGKSTLARLLQKTGLFYWCEADLFFLDEEGNYNFDIKQIKEAHNYCKSMIADALAHNLNVIVSNTFTQKWEMQPYLTMAKAYGIEPFIIETKGTWANIHNVPQEVIERMKNRWEILA